MKFDMEMEIMKAESFLEEAFPLEREAEADTESMDREVEDHCQVCDDEDLEPDMEFSEVDEIDDF